MKAFNHRSPIGGAIWVEEVWVVGGSGPHTALKSTASGWRTKEYVEIDAFPEACVCLAVLDTNSHINDWNIIDFQVLLNFVVVFLCEVGGIN